jgi:predicted HicB family RNase H-like nuclease
MTDKKKVDRIPEEFSDYEQAAEFWDEHDTTKYADDFKTIDVEAELRQRHFEVELDEDVAKQLREHAKQRGISLSRLVSEMLRGQLSA